MSCDEANHFLMLARRRLAEANRVYRRAMNSDSRTRLAKAASEKANAEAEVESAEAACKQVGIKLSA